MPSPLNGAGGFVLLLFVASDCSLLSIKGDPPADLRDADGFCYRLILTPEGMSVALQSDCLIREFSCRVSGGTFTLPSHGTVLDSLPSHGSSYLTLLFKLLIIFFLSQFVKSQIWDIPTHPMREHLPVVCCTFSEPVIGFAKFRTKTLVLALHPS